MVTKEERLERENGQLEKEIREVEREIEGILERQGRVKEEKEGFGDGGGGGGRARRLSVGARAGPT